MIAGRPSSILGAPQQLLPPDAYTSPGWFDREIAAIFSNAWTYATVATQMAKPGDYVTVQAGRHPLVVVRDEAGTLRGFHNICRHRGTEILEGQGNAGRTLVCPYHFWSYDLDGVLRGVPNHAECFPQLNKGTLGLHEAGIGVFKDIVFVHPDPRADFDSWLADLPDHAWPHDLTKLIPGREIVYEMNCNWKIYFENAIDGYHLAYLHAKTIGGPMPSKNVWETHGQHLVWYSTEGEGRKSSMTQHMTKGLRLRDLTKIQGAEDGQYGGVFMLFPMTIVSPKPYGMNISQLVPLAPDLTLLKTRKWNPPGEAGNWASEETTAALSAMDPKTQRVKLRLLDRHPLETGSFRMEDVWICEKLQRSLRSPLFAVGALARGWGAETPLVFFQQTVLDCVSATERG